MTEPDIGLGIAVRTFLDEDEASDDEKARAARLAAFPATFVPYAEAFTEDLRIACDFFRALNKGLQILNDKELDPAHKAAWATALKFLDARPF